MATPIDLLQDLMLLSRAAQIALQDDVLRGVRAAGLSPARTSILRLLGQRRRQSVNDLARFLGQTKAAASQNVDALAGAGLVRRETGEADRRLVWVLLTPAGSRLLSKLEARQRAILGKALAAVPSKALERLSRGLRRLAFALLDGCSAGAASCLQCCAYNSAGCVKGPGGWRCAYALGGSAPRTARSRRRRRGGGE